MKKLLEKLHLFFLIYICYNVYTSYEEHSEKMVNSEGRIPIVERKILKKTKELKALKKYEKDIEVEKNKIELVAREVEKLQKKLPSEVSATANLSLFKATAEALNIKNIYLTPREEKDNGFYLSKNYQFKGVGTYLQFLIFLEKIGENEQLLNIQSVEFDESANKQRGRFKLINGTIEIEAFRYNPNYIEDRGIERIENMYKDGKKSKAKKKKV